MMQIDELLAWFDNGGSFGDDPEVLASMRAYIQETRRLLFEMNSVWHEDEKEIPELFARITAKPVGENVRIETPFYTDFGKNITVGSNVFINAGCKFQDQGGIVIGDGAFIGHNVVACHAGPRREPGEKTFAASCPDPHRKPGLDRRKRRSHKRRDDRRQFDYRGRCGRDARYPGERPGGRRSRESKEDAVRFLSGGQISDYSFSN